MTDERAQGAGRPRQAALDARIKESAVALLSEKGFAGLSVNSICKRAGVPRPTFYRRWPSGVAALVEAFNDRFEGALLEDTGDVAADLLTYCIRVRNRYDDPIISVCLPAIYEARRVAPDLVRPIGEAQRERHRINVRTLAGALATQGIAPMLNAQEILFTLIAAIDQGYLTRRAVSDEFITRLVTTLLR
ncbi:MAG: TetR/AcrR family transcriptional regulator [Sphingomonas bacterium]